MTDEHKGGIIVGLAAFEGVLFTIIVYLNASFTVWSSSLYPSVGNGDMIAIKSTVVSIVFIWVLARMHKALQKALCKYGSKPSGWFFLLDLSTSFAPVAALVIAWFVDLMYRPPGGYYAWALWYLALISMIVIDAIHEDILAMLRHKR